MTGDRRLRVSVVAPCRDEIAYLPGLFEAIDAQARAVDQVVVVDGMSDDGSHEWLLDRAAQDPRLVVVRNPRRTVPTAMNLGIEAATGDVVARMDVHADYAPDYLQHLVDLLERRPDISGAGGTYVMRGQGRWGGAIAAVLSHPVGLGGAPHRRAVDAGPVAHVGTGVYRRSALVDVGGFDPELLANEDFELDHRLGRAGHVIWLEPRARFASYSRPGPRPLARQMWRYGFFKARTLVLHPDSLKARQLAPPAVVGLVLLATVVRPRWGAGLLGSYLVTAAAAGAMVARRAGASPVHGAATVPLVHLVWGSGVLAGLPVHRLRLRRRAGHQP